jgi:hypothetical protein
MYFSIGLFFDSNCLRPKCGEWLDEERLGGTWKLTSLRLERVALDVWRREAVCVKLFPYFVRVRGIWLSPIHHLFFRRG